MICDFIFEHSIIAKVKIMGDKIEIINSCDVVKILHFIYGIEDISFPVRLQENLESLSKIKCRLITTHAS